jgi:hypothetical protein
MAPSLSKPGPRRPLLIANHSFHFLLLNGRGERIRTSDPLVPNQVLYQAEPLPELANGRMFTGRKGPGPIPL